MKIPDNIRDILVKLTDYHDNLKGVYGRAYIVGGACRDFLFGEEPSDFDIVTSLEPWQVKEILPEAKEVSESFPVCITNDGVEIATYRKDKGDYAEVARTLKEDIIRRDFTINGIVYDPFYNGISSFQEGFIDYVGGRQDIKNRVLRFIGTAERRIQEDPVRILRGIRFAAKYNLTIEKETYFEMFRLRYLLKEITGERLQLEVTKAFKNKNTHRFLTLLNEMEMLEYVFPNIVALRGVDGGDYHRETCLSHSFNAVKAVDDKSWQLKLAALMHDYGKRSPVLNDKGFNTFHDHNVTGVPYIIGDLKDHLKFSNDVVDYVKNLSLMHMLHVDLSSEKAIRRAYIKLLENNVSLKDFIYLRYADSKGNVKNKSTFFGKWMIYRRMMEVLHKKHPFSIKDLEVGGNDIMATLGIKQGKIVGDILKDVFEQVQEELIKNDKTDIIEYVERTYGETQ